VLLACLPGEAHDVGLVIFGLLVSRRGWRVTFLGADTPLETLERTIRSIRPSLTVLATVSPRLLTACADGIRSIAALAPAAVAGVTDAERVVDVGARVLSADIVEAARSLAP
jgi:methanogenic corrinoid protein MtbC1